MTPKGADILNRYRPRRFDAEVWAALRPRVIELVTGCDPTDSVVTRTTGAVARFLVWAMLEGHAASSDEVWQDKWIEQHVRQSTVSDKSTLRTDLRRVARQGPYVPLGRPRMAKRPLGLPYSIEEQATLWRLVDAQATENRKLRLGVFLCCGFGAGLGPVEQRYAAPDWVSHVEGATVLTVPTGVHAHFKPRVVPMVEPWGQRLTDLLAGWPYELLGSGDSSPGSKTTLSKLWRRCTGKDEAPPLTASRMMTTYRVGLLADGVPFWVMWEVAGVSPGVYETLKELLGHDDGRHMLQAPAHDVESIVAAWKAATL